VFGLRFNDEEESYFMLEIDRGEMPIERYNNLHRTYFAKKILTYYEAGRQQWYVHDLGIRNLRVATVTTTPERVSQMLDSLKQITDGRGSSMFLFTDELTLAASNPLDVEWGEWQRRARPDYGLGIGLLLSVPNDKEEQARLTSLDRGALSRRRTRCGSQI